MASSTISTAEQEPFRFQSEAMPSKALAIIDRLWPPMTIALMDRNTTVLSPEELVKEAWFLDAIEERPDFLYVLLR